MNSTLTTTETNGRPSPAVVLEFLKPVTWFPPMWAFLCGVVSSGAVLSDNWVLVVLGVLLAGPLVCACSQAVNDWYDRHVDAINQPERPIPSGRLPGKWGWYLALVWTGLSALVATLLGPVGFAAGMVGLALAWAYSAPPFRLKANGWAGNGAVGLCYEGLPWITGAAVMLGGATPAWPVFLLAFLYSVGAHGIMTLNDFKSIKGDQLMGVASLPVQLGVNGAAKAACWFMVVPQLVVVLFLVLVNQTLVAALVAVLIAGQMVLMKWFRADPVERATRFSAAGVLLYVLGMLASAFALRAMAIAQVPV